MSQILPGDRTFQNIKKLHVYELGNAVSMIQSVRQCYFFPIYNEAN